MNKHNIHLLHARFNQGLASATDPENEISLQTGGAAITTLQSFWLYRLCPVCKHTFRLHDPVQIDAGGVIRHDSALLPCAKNTEPDLEQSTEEIKAFFSGLDEAWPPPADIPVQRLDFGHRLLSPPLGGFKRHSCAVCGHTLRLHDHVIICPCSPLAPKCEKAVHRDPLHGLHCFEKWNPGANSQNYCPVSSKKIK